ncbi:MAG TPA: 5-(carboxyamino)imidazole ribonucleotide mutase [Lachnospiraceae bacterium]|nr:5-(carboxyamino)imidazole ribonucleotide mutase [Lachnospiraceae bacterium]
MRVAVIMGSTSDLPKVEPAIKIMKDYGVQVDVRCLSAHRAHAGLSAFIEEANGNGTEVFITAAGMAAALPGVVASQTVLPVIGVPISGSVLDGQDALYSIVQMPSGIPVATVAVDGAKNAAILAARILAVSDPELLQKVVAYGEEGRRGVMAKDEKLQKVGYKNYNA